MKDTLNSDGATIQTNEQNDTSKIDSIDIEHIMDIAKAIKASDIKNKEEYFAGRYSIFSKKYPQLYKKVCTDPNFDMGNLEFMLRMIGGIQKREQNTYNAEVQIGQMLFDKYVKDGVKKK